MKVVIGLLSRLFIQENLSSKESKALECLASKYKDLLMEGSKNRLKLYQKSDFRGEGWTR